MKRWHHHQELELVLILQGEGTYFIGDRMAPFGPGDFVLLGDYLPHKWQNNAEYFEDQGLIAEAIIIHFEKSFLSNALEETIELGGLLRLIKSSQRGISFRGASKQQASKRLMKILNTEPGLDRMILLLDLLRLLVEESAFEYIATSGYINSAYERDIKLRKINNYVMNNFQHQISLSDIANEICMNEAAFCRYFKKTTDVTFSTYLNEIRIGFACKLLHRESIGTIASVCYESGFNNLSNFNQKFKQFTGYTPSDYRRAIG